MALKKLIVKGLFLTFDYEINLDKKDIVIIIGENGVGKTTLLKILDAVMSDKLQYLFSIEFNLIELHFSSTVWSITKQEDKYIIIKDKERGKPYKICKDDRDEQMQLLKNYYVANNHDERESFLELYTKLITNNLLYESDLFNHKNHFELKNNCPDWFKRTIKDNNIMFIRTQRLYKSTYEEGSKSKSLEHMIVIYSKELVKRLQQNNTEFTSESIKLDSTFPKRLLAERQKNGKVSIQDIENEIQNLINYRSLLSKVGIIDKQEDEVIKGYWDEHSRSILNLYVKDSRKKLDVFKDTATKLDLLCNLINKRFKYKKLYIDSSEGFVIKAEKDDKKIEITDLSSGEQNELILFYQLLFKTKNGDLVLIDEPEISLHIRWQQQLIGDMKEIADETGIKLLIATHSPDIIGDNWSMVQILGKQ